MDQKNPKKQQFKMAVRKREKQKESLKHLLKAGKIKYVTYKQQLEIIDI